MIQDDVSPLLRPYWQSRRSIGGAFTDIDFILFDKILNLQAGQAPGDLLEIGVLRGRSAVVVGLHAGSDEFIACDVFEESGVDEANTRENKISYGNLTRLSFESNYKRFVSTSPRIIQGLSSVLPEHVTPGSLRFAHIDGGHLYEVVRDDLINVERLLSDDGVVVLDDFRAVHTPGVAASVWAAVANTGLVPFCLSESKFYGSWNAELAASHLAEMSEWIGGYPEVNAGTQRIADHEVLIIGSPQISSPRRRIKSLMPPVLAEAVRPTKPPYLGE